MFSAVVFASDKYGDHGLVGFYMQFKNERVNKLIHFVFSCRIMNIGLEQFVYELVGEPEVQIVEPVSNPIKAFAAVDWIEQTHSETELDSADADQRLLLLGSCDLTAVATYCSKFRAEYVNGVNNGVMTRYDDFGFILSDMERVRTSTALANIPCWQKDDYFAFRSDLEHSEVLILSLSASMIGSYLVTDDGVVVRVHPLGLGDYIDLDPWAGFLNRCQLFSIDLAQREVLLGHSLKVIANAAANAKFVALLGANTRDIAGTLSDEDLAARNVYNRTAERFCSEHANWSFVSIDKIVSKDKLVDDRHYTRLGYYDIADHIMKTVRSLQGTPSASSPLVREAEWPGILDSVRAGKQLSRWSHLGHKRGVIERIKRTVKLSPLSDVVRRIIGRRPANAAASWQ